MQLESDLEVQQLLFLLHLEGRMIFLRINSNVGKPVVLIRTLSKMQAHSGHLLGD